MREREKEREMWRNQRSHQPAKDIQCALFLKNDSAVNLKVSPEF